MPSVNNNFHNNFQFCYRLTFLNLLHLYKRNANNNIFNAQLRPPATRHPRPSLIVPHVHFPPCSIVLMNCNYSFAASQSCVANRLTIPPSSPRPDEHTNGRSKTMQSAVAQRSRSIGGTRGMVRLCRIN